MAGEALISCADDSDPYRGEARRRWLLLHLPGEPDLSAADRHAVATALGGHPRLTAEACGEGGEAGTTAGERENLWQRRRERGFGFPPLSRLSGRSAPEAAWQRSGRWP